MLDWMLKLRAFLSPVVEEFGSAGNVESRAIKEISRDI
jgi:hypothetical protein